MLTDEPWRRFGELAKLYKSARRENKPIPFNIMELSDAAAALLPESPTDAAMIRRDIAGILESDGIVSRLLALQALVPEARHFLDPALGANMLTFAEAVLVAKLPKERQLIAARNLSLRQSRSLLYYIPANPDSAATNG